MYNKLKIINPVLNKHRLNGKLFLLNLFFEIKRWIHANPTLYAGSSEYKKYLLTNYADDYCNALYEKLTSAHEGGLDLIFLVGKRGSGKTTLLNYFLNEKTRDLNSSGYTWIRVDTTKIYTNEFNLNKSLSFKKYIAGQLLFVYFRYCGHHTDPCFKDKTPMNIKSNFDEIRDNYDQVLHSVNLREIIKTKRPDLLDTYDQIYKKALETPHFYNSLDGKPFEQQEIADLLLNEIKDRLILIIDGIDNISYTSPIFDEVEEDLVAYINEEKETDRDQKKFHKILIALRDENYTRISKKIPALNELHRSTHSTTTNIIIIDKIPSLKEIVRHYESRIEKIDQKNMEISDCNNSLLQILETYREVLQNHPYYKDLCDKSEDNLTISEKSIAENIKTFFGRYDDLIKRLPGTNPDDDQEEILKLFDERYFFIDNYTVQELRRRLRKFDQDIENLIGCFYSQEVAHSSNSTHDLRRLIKDTPIRSYFVFTNKFEDSIAESFFKRGVWERDKSTTVEPLIDSLFNGDLREMFILSYHSYFNFVDFILHNWDPATDESNFVDYIRLKSLNIAESVFKNGNRYMIDRSDVMFHPPYRNINFLNLLNVPCKHTSSYSPLYFVCLQSFIETESKKLEEILDHFCRFNDSNCKKFIEDTLKNLLEHGYCALSDLDNIHYKATAKGINTLNYSLHDIKVMHAYLFNGLIDERFHKYLTIQTSPHPVPQYHIYNDHQFASALQINTAILYYQLVLDRDKLNQNGIKCDVLKSIKKKLIPKTVRESFEGYYERNSYLKNDLQAIFGEKEDDITPQEHSILNRKHYLYQSIYDFAKRYLFYFRNYKSLFEEKKTKEIMKETLTPEEKYFYLDHYLALNIDEIIEKGKYHAFVFGDYDEEKELERKRQLQKYDNTTLFEDFRDFKNNLDKKLDEIIKNTSDN